MEDGAQPNPPPNGAETSFRIIDGAVFVGDVEISLATEQILLNAADKGERSLKFTIRETDSMNFTEAWQRAVHSNRRYKSAFPVSELVPSASSSAQVIYSERADIHYLDVSYVDVIYANISYLELLSGQVKPTDVIYNEVIYADVRYADVIYASVAVLDFRQGSAAPPGEFMTLTITGNSERGSRRVLTIEGIEGVDLRLGASKGKVVDVLVRFASSLPADRLIWAIEGR